MTLKPRRCWFQFGLRTLLAAVTIFGVWLGWNVRQVHRRADILSRLGAENSREVLWDLIAGQSAVRAQMRLPFVWSLLGAQARSVLVVHRDQFSDGEIAEIQELFPEAQILVADYGGTETLPLSRN